MGGLGASFWSCDCFPRFFILNWGVPDFFVISFVTSSLRVEPSDCELPDEVWRFHMQGGSCFKKSSSFRFIIIFPLLGLILTTIQFPGKPRNNQAPPLYWSLVPKIWLLVGFLKFYTVQYRKRRYFPHIFVNVMAPGLCMLISRLVSQVYHSRHADRQTDLTNRIMWQ